MIRAAFAALALIVSACATTPAPTLPSAAAIDTEAQRLMAAQDVKGMAIAVIDDGQIVHVAAYGHRNVERDLPLTTDTVMYGASITKAAFAYMVMQLVDEGRLDLDRPLADYLPRPLIEYADGDRHPPRHYTDLAGDERWRGLTARVALTHSTGFLNFRWLEPDEKLRFHADPGARYGYSAEGFYLLQFALEEGLGLDVEAEMQRRVYDRFGMTRTSLRWRADFATNLADGYGIDGAFEAHDERSNLSAAGSMDTTIADQARLWAGVVRGDGLSAAARAEMVRGGLAIPFAHQFPTMSDEVDPLAADIGLAAGLGVVTFDDASGPMWFKGGHNDTTGNMLICQEARRRCVVFLGNSVRAELIYPELTRFILGETVMPWWWEYNPG